ncbi:hypothetical protein ER308_14685 [Egibacter rhizosphaerae]|uniref:AMP-dependent synthetase/ligase domain-containing protein n=1 Tax=Egibacter rhizosphaerae TaxID=1670831 RepID=A0A411YHY6_9ACTN|nr:TIGR03089 family protein [Egibacter rhizosphaerae]QBI20682.1 hypothetical protein ER308_14685 [Egibacter rhizosphaerae]
MSAPAPRTVGDALAARLARDADRPLLTYRDLDTGERTELGAATFENWAAKCADRLLDDIEPGELVEVAADGSWLGFVAVVGGGLLQAVVRVRAGAPSADTATCRIVHERFGPGADDLVVGAGLGGRPTDPAASAFATEVLEGADVVDLPDAEPQAPWLDLGAATRTQEEALGAGAALATVGAGSDRRLALGMSIDDPRGCAVAAAALASGASILATRGGPRDAADEQDADEQAVQDERNVRDAQGERGAWEAWSGAVGEERAHVALLTADGLSTVAGLDSPPTLEAVLVPAVIPESELPAATTAAERLGADLRTAADGVPRLP